MRFEPVPNAWGERHHLRAYRPPRLTATGVGLISQVLATGYRATLTDGARKAQALESAAKRSSGYGEPDGRDLCTDDEGPDSQVRQVLHGGNRKGGMMTRLLRYAVSLGCAVIFASGCDPERSPVGPTGEVVTFSATLLSGNQPTAVVGSEANGTGTATMAIAISRGEGGAISSAVASIAVTLSNYPSTMVISSAEVRRGEAGSPGIVVFDLGVAPGAVPIAGGAGTINTGSVQVSAPTVQDMLNSPSGFFLTFATIANPNGVARGQFSR